MVGAAEKRSARHLSTHYRGWLPPTFHDVADLAHAADIGVADAALLWAAIAIRIETVAVSRSRSRWSGEARETERPILRRHVPIERGQTRVGAHGDLAAGPGAGAVEAWPRRSDGVRPASEARRRLKSGATVGGCSGVRSAFVCVRGWSEQGCG